jgi:hypothetical protein
MKTEQERLQELARQMYESAEHAPWELSPEDIRAQRRRRVMVIPDLKAMVLVAAAIVLIVAGFFVFDRPTSHKSAVRSSTTTTTLIPGRSVVVPQLVGMTEAAAERVLSSAGLSRGVIAGVAGALYPAGTVVATDPSAGASVAKGSIVSLTISAPASSNTTIPARAPATTNVTPTTSSPSPASTTPPAQSNCASGNVSYTVSANSDSTCVKLGARLTVTFDSLGWWGGYGSWSDSSPTISDNSILTGSSYAPSGSTATAEFNAVGTGTATVVAQFDVTCAPADTTPCTVPPQALETLTVTVGAS